MSSTTPKHASFVKFGCLGKGGFPSIRWLTSPKRACSLPCALHFKRPREGPCGGGGGGSNSELPQAGFPESGEVFTEYFWQK